MTEAQLAKTLEMQRSNGRFRMPDSVRYALYVLALLASIGIWFALWHAPLSLDETGTYRQISAGFSHIWSRQYICFPTYTYILWFSTKIIGTSEIALRIPSVFAMLGAAWLLYLAARELFSRELALLAAIIFCLHPIVIFESIDIRPYAFGVLAVNATILVLLRLRRSDSNGLAALFGLLAAVIVSFHYLFASILPAFVICLFIVKAKDPKAVWRQFGIAAAVFALAFLPMISGLESLYRSGGTHVYEAPPQFGKFIWTIGSILLLYLFGGAVIITGAFAAISHRSGSQNHIESWRILVCASLALIPLLILYGVSVATPIHMFAARHRLVAIPGIALCWALLSERYLNRPVRLLFCVVLVGATSFIYFRARATMDHGDTWKYALAVAQKDASADNAPVVICSDFPEADYALMPLSSAKTSRFFAQLSYYKLTVPVVPMPRALNAEAIRVGTRFLQEATQKRERFLALAFQPSYPTLNWLSRQASTSYGVHDLGVYKGIKVLEFTPRAAATRPAARSSARPLPRGAKAASRPHRLSQEPQQ